MSSHMTFDEASRVLCDAVDKIADATDLLLLISMAHGERETTPQDAAICTGIELASNTLREASRMIDDAQKFVKEKR